MRTQPDNRVMPDMVHFPLDRETPSEMPNGTHSVVDIPHRSKKRKRKQIDEGALPKCRGTEIVPSKNGLDVLVQNPNLQEKRNAKDILSTDSRPNEVQTRTNDGSQMQHFPSKMRNKINGLVNETSQSSLKAKADKLCPLRKTLPVWSLAQEIRQGLKDKHVMLLVGETGSGKSTQVPQILNTEPWCKPRSVTLKDSQKSFSVGGCIAITEPRRVAAITLARRVAEEMGTPLGSSSPASRVGYSVRFDNSTSPCTKIKFLTEGMLLQEMLRDPWLKSYSAVIVDEVHERGVNVDLILGFMRNLIADRLEGRGGVPLKVVVMSATLEMERLGNFFEEGCSANSNSTLSKQPADGQPDDESEWSGISESDQEELNVSAQRRARRLDKGNNRGAESTASCVHGNGTEYENVKGSHMVTHFNGMLPEEPAMNEKSSDKKFAYVAKCHIQGRQHPVTVHYTPEPVHDWVDAALRTIFQIHHKEPMPGDVLVFLTGQETVESLECLVNEYALGLSRDVPKMLVLPLFAALPQAAQQRVFQPAPPRARKIILATNIAETSVTVSGVRFVIDCGKAKIKQFRSRIGLDSLLVKPVSKSAAIQRKGRAGREAPGQCYRLYTEAAYLELQQSNTPEILRCDLSHAILTMKARGVDDVVNFPFLDHPSRDAMEKALLQLYRLGALTDSGTISEIGQKMAKLPLTVSLGRVLIAAAQPEFDCVFEVIDIISCLSVENVFLNLATEEKKEKAESARHELYRREGDHLTLLTTVQAYAAEHSDRKAWADRHFVSHRAMHAVMDVRKQLRAQHKQYHRLEPEDIRVITPEMATRVLKCFVMGFPTNTARLMPDGSYKTVIGNQTVAIHPSSVLFGRKVEAILYNEFVFTTKSYARGVSAVQMNWIGEAMGV